MGEVVVGELLEGRPSPLRQRVAQDAGGSHSVVLDKGARSVNFLFKALRVDRFRFDLEEIAVVLGHQDLGMSVSAPVGLENRPQTGYIDPQSILFAFRFLSPKFLEDVIGCYHPVGME